MKPPLVSTLAQALHRFFTVYLPEQRAMSPHTLHSYRDSLKLLLRHAAGKSQDPSVLAMEQLTVPRVVAFLQHLEAARKNRPCTRNVRLTAIHSFFRFVGAQYPQHLEQAQRILSVPFKRTEIREVQHLDLAEIRAVLKTMDRSRRDGRRDYALLSLLFNTGARVSEIVDLNANDLTLTAPPSILLRGKGKKQRRCPLWPETARVLRQLLEEMGIDSNRPESVFRNRWGRALTRFGIRFILAKYIRRAAEQVSSLRSKRLHPHSVRHSTALFLLRSGVDLSTIAHWLGHADLNTTNKYLSLDLEEKRLALAKAKTVVKPGRGATAWRKNHSLIRWLEAL
jgi:integrase/recombinase XerD